MSKRVNPHRRLLAAQAQLLADARLEQSRVNGVDMAKLQQGRVRSPLAPTVQLTAYRTPKPASDDIPARKGKIVNGLFKANRGQRARFSPK